MTKEKGIEFINNVHLRDGCRDSTVSFLLINHFVKIGKNQHDFYMKLPSNYMPII